MVSLYRGSLATHNVHAVKELKNIKEEKSPIVGSGNTERSDQSAAWKAVWHPTWRNWDLSHRVKLLKGFVVWQKDFLSLYSCIRFNAITSFLVVVRGTADRVEKRRWSCLFKTSIWFKISDWSKTPVFINGAMCVFFIIKVLRNKHNEKIPGFVPVVRPSLVKVCSAFFLCNRADKPTNRQTDRQTDRQHRWKHNILVINSSRLQRKKSVEFVR